MKTEMTDRQLVTLVLGGKTQAYSDIVSRHSALVFAKAMGVVRYREPTFGPGLCQGHGRGAMS